MLNYLLAVKKEEESLFRLNESLKQGLTVDILLAINYDGVVLILRVTPSSSKYQYYCSILEFDMKTNKFIKTVVMEELSEIFFNGSLAYSPSNRPKDRILDIVDYLLCRHNHSLYDSLTAWRHNAL